MTDDLTQPLARMFTIRNFTPTPRVQLHPCTRSSQLYRHLQLYSRYRQYCTIPRLAVSSARCTRGPASVDSLAGPAGWPGRSECCLCAAAAGASNHALTLRTARVLAPAGLRRGPAREWRFMPVWTSRQRQSYRCSPGSGAEQYDNATNRSGSAGRSLPACRRQRRQQQK